MLPKNCGPASFQTRRVASPVSVHKPLRVAISRRTRRGAGGRGLAVRAIICSCWFWNTGGGVTLRLRSAPAQAVGLELSFAPATLRNPYDTLPHAGDSHD